VTKKTQKTLGISAGVMAVLAIGIAVSPLPGWLSNYVDMLQAMRAFGKANDAYGVKEYEVAIQYYREAAENAPQDNPVIQTTLRFFTGSSSHLLFKPTLFDDAENDAYLDDAVDEYEATLNTIAEAMQDPEMDGDTRQTLLLY